MGVADGVGVGLEPGAGVDVGPEPGVGAVPGCGGDPGGREGPADAEGVGFAEIAEPALLAELIGFEFAVAWAWGDRCGCRRIRPASASTASPASGIAATASSRKKRVGSLTDNAVRV